MTCSAGARAHVALGAQHTLQRVGEWEGREVGGEEIAPAQEDPAKLTLGRRSVSSTLVSDGAGRRFSCSHNSLTVACTWHGRLRGRAVGTVSNVGSAATAWHK